MGKFYNYHNDALAISRLFKEYKEHGNNLVIAYDFDNTIYDCHKRGLNLEPVITALKTANHLGLTLIAFTANNDHDLVRRVSERLLGVENVAINVSPLDDIFKSRKPFFNLLLDDRAGLASALQHLETLNSMILDERTA